MSTVTFEVLCDKHGVQQSSVNYPHKCLAVGRPTTKKERYSGGCPMCKKEQREAKVSN